MVKFFLILEAHLIAHIITFILILAYSSETIFDNSFKDFFEALKGAILFCGVGLQLKNRSRQIKKLKRVNDLMRFLKKINISVIGFLKKCKFA